MTAKEVRQEFLKFFESKQHQIVPSAPIVVKNDPTLMFTNAGMNQFKELFLGEAEVQFSRVVDTQRCLRVSGKHNDLEEVGIDTYHHTMFEMLGNWSFGDYFKKDAIAWSWELLTEVYKIPKDRLYVTYFEGDAKEGIEKDQEAYDLWKQYIAEDRILPGNKKDNFWEMGETGPCGPCSEIHVDCRTETERAASPGASLVNADHPQVIEIWNNVFIQFNRIKDGSLHPLPAKHVDTGMGFERLVRVLQQKTSNYDTDVFQPLIQYIAQSCHIKYGDNEKTDIAMRVMADHIRAISFVIADGQLPSNNKAGYVIRRILRRAVRYAYTFLNLKQPFLNELVPLLAEQFKGVFDGLYAQKDFVQKVVLEEELSFLRTLETGIQRFEKYQAKNQTVDGNFAFELYDTFGFPIDLTDLMAREKGLTVDMKGFNEALEVQKNRSRAATAIDTGDWINVNPNAEQQFVGYDMLKAETQIIKYRKVASKGETQYQLVLSNTPFYAEGGGQVGDTGFILDTARNEKISINDTKKENALFMHYTDTLPTDLNAVFIAEVDMQKRRDTENNHSATHLMHEALRQVLGTHVEQKGSLVNSEVLRFDISHFAKITEAELNAVEDMVNAKIRANIPLKEERDVPFQQAIETGVTALFGEKYGDKVRIITFDDEYSKELCGGTHVKATGQIGFFKIISESAVAAGVRRIEAITGSKSAQVIREQFEMVNELTHLLNNPKDFVNALTKVLEDNTSLRKEVEKSIANIALALKEDMLKRITNINGIPFLAAEVELPTADAVKTLAYAIKAATSSLFMVLACVIEGKPSLLVMLSEDLVKEKGLHAGNIIRDLAKEIQGGGGGQPFFATAGGKTPEGILKALEKAKTFIQ